MKKSIQDLKEQAPEIELLPNEDQQVKGGSVIEDNIQGF